MVKIFEFVVDDGHDEDDYVWDNVVRYITFYFKLYGIPVVGVVYDRPDDVDPEEVETNLDAIDLIEKLMENFVVGKIHIQLQSVLEELKGDKNG
jgi:hypothetical protein